MSGRAAVRVSLTEEARTGTAGVDYIDMPTFLVIPVGIVDGTVSVEILSRLRRDAPEYSRAFAGLAYRIANGGERFEAIYLRPLNGLKLRPPTPRDRRAVQYFAYPEWKFERLREAFPDGPYEAGADIGPDEWITFVIDFDGRSARASVNGVGVMTISDTLADPVRGDVGLWVDIGTEAYFSNLRIESRDR